MEGVQFDFISKPSTVPYSSVCDMLIVHDKRDAIGETRTQIKCTVRLARTPYEIKGPV